MKQFFRLWRDEKAVALIEFALAAPIFLLLFAGAIEMTRFVLANQKVDKSSNALSDYVSQLPDAKGVNPDELLETFKVLMNPYDTDKAEFIITTISHSITATQDSDPLNVDWQVKRGGLSYASKVGATGGQPNAVVNNLGVKVGESIVAVEVFYQHKNILTNVGEIAESLDFEKQTAATPIYKVAYFRQRQVIPSVKPGKPQTMPRMTCCGYYCKTTDDVVELPTCACTTDSPKCISQSALDDLEEEFKGDPVVLAALKKCTAICEPSGGGDPVTPFCDIPGNQDTCRCSGKGCPSGGEVQ